MNPEARITGVDIRGKAHEWNGKLADIPWALELMSETFWISQFQVLIGGPNRPLT